MAFLQCEQADASSVLNFQQMLYLFFDIKIVKKYFDASNYAKVKKFELHTTFSTNMNTRTVRMQVFSHGRIISEHFTAAFVRTC